MAIEDFNNAIRLKPDNAAAYNSRGAIFIKFGQYQMAIEDLNNTIRLKPDDADAYNNRGTIYTKLGQYQMAIEDFNNAIRLKPDDADTCLCAKRGIIYFTKTKGPLLMRRGILFFFDKEQYNSVTEIFPSASLSIPEEAKIYLVHYGKLCPESI